MAKILLVEDDNNLREIYEARLSAEGYDIIAARDGEEALAVAVKEKPDLIISDVMMPKISGFDMLDILRGTPETKNCKVIMMTALSQAEDKARADKLGADRYLVKSQVTLEDVAKVAKEVLEGDSMPATPDSSAQPTSSSPASAASEPAADNPVVAASTIPQPTTASDSPPVADSSDATGVPLPTVNTTVDTTVPTSNDDSSASATPIADTSAQTSTSTNITPAQTAAPAIDSSTDTKPAGEAPGFLVDGPTPVPASTTPIPPAEADESSKIAQSIESFLSTKETAVSTPNLAPSVAVQTEATATPAPVAESGLETMKFVDTATSSSAEPTPHKLVLEDQTAPSSPSSATVENVPGAPPASSMSMPGHKVIQPLNDLSKPPVDLQALAQKEEDESTAASILNPVTTESSQPTPDAPIQPLDTEVAHTTPATETPKPNDTIDPNSLAL